ncbi:hypothetical protein E0379_08660 [Campylobacter upsaliensis]|uniref:hypothetical protein n=1 Tax=Campylobacter TaxID=194 RepID=UPI00139E874C|nr:MULTISPECIES: hypothetical protein [Campylobacter]EAI0687904.1 hypothetical protein [Campylobacter upsaliensis]EAI8565217.1 hypothetical protein [Campylobacter upsaliensis]EIZ5520648.1 hypothetical protein [Campylobacter upsaliensis]EIZ9324766.1 hypothetical protein [Campylobacter upsaliensis]ELU9590385.1 hypothetical protein [Campylobacter upsaliensis]
MKKEILTKEEFKSLRAEAGFKSDSEFLRKLGFLSLNVANSWFNGHIQYPKFLRSVLFLFALKQNFETKKYEKFMLDLSLLANEKISKEAERKAKLKKSDRELIRKAKLALNGLSFAELESKNIELHKELEILEKLEIEMKG